MNPHKIWRHNFCLNRLSSNASTQCGKSPKNMGHSTDTMEGGGIKKQLWHTWGSAQVGLRQEGGEGAVARLNLPKPQWLGGEGGGSSALGCLPGPWPEEKPNWPFSEFRRRRRVPSTFGHVPFPPQRVGSGLGELGCCPPPPPKPSATPQKLSLAVAKPGQRGGEGGEVRGEVGQANNGPDGWMAGWGAPAVTKCRRHQTRFANREAMGQLATGPCDGHQTSWVSAWITQELLSPTIAAAIFR